MMLREHPSILEVKKVVPAIMLLWYRPAFKGGRLVHISPVALRRLSLGGRLFNILPVVARHMNILITILLIP